MMGWPQQSRLVSAKRAIERLRRALRHSRVEVLLPAVCNIEGRSVEPTDSSLQGRLGGCLAWGCAVARCLWPMPGGSGAPLRAGRGGAVSVCGLRWRCSVGEYCWL